MTENLPLSLDMKNMSHTNCYMKIFFSLFPFFLECFFYYNKVFVNALDDDRKSDRWWSDVDRPQITGLRLTRSEKVSSPWSEDILK